MSYSNFSALADNSSTPIPWVPTLAQDVIPSLARPLPEGDEGQYYARLDRRLAERILQPITNPDPGPQASSEARQPMDAATAAPRHRLLAPAPAKQETVARDPEATSTPVLPRRKDLPAVPRRGIDRKKIAKVFAACMRCREQKQRCDGGIPHCKRCISGKHNCSYILSQRQIDFARRTKAKIAVAQANSVEQNGSYETALADRSDLAPPGRAIVPRTEAPGPIFGGLTADPQDQPLYYDGFGSGSDTRSTGFFRYPHDSGWAVGGFENPRNGVEPVVQEPDWQSEGLYTRPKEFLDYPQYPGLAFGGLDFSPNDFLRLSQEINFGFGGYPTQLSGPSSFSELGPILETPTTSLNSASLYAQGPGMAFANPTTSSDSSLPAKNKSWVEILFEKHPELFPELQQNPSA